MPKLDILSNTSEVWTMPMPMPKLDVFFDGSDIGVECTCSAESGTEYSAMHVPDDYMESYDS